MSAAILWRLDEHGTLDRKRESDGSAGDHIIQC
jgi:hypothetical protein